MVAREFWIPVVDEKGYWMSSPEGSKWAGFSVPGTFKPLLVHVVRETAHGCYAKPVDGGKQFYLHETSPKYGGEDGEQRILKAVAYENAKRPAYLETVAQRLAEED